MSTHGGWFPYDKNADYGDQAHPGQSVRVVGIGAICDFASEASESGSSQSFSVRQFVELENGRHVVIGDRGFTQSSVRQLQVLEDGRQVALENVAPARSGMTRDRMRRHVLNVVLPDDDEGEEAHPWSWLAEQARRHGIAVTADELKALPYQVVLTQRLAGWLQTP